MNLDRASKQRRTKWCASPHGDFRMTYRLQDNVSFCRVDDHLVFLDMRHDRYFRLSATMERAFLACIENRRELGSPPRVLIDRNIITDAPQVSPRVFTETIARPTRSALERTLRSKRLSIAMLLEVLTIIPSIRLQLATRNLSKILTTLTAYRRDRAARQPDVITEAQEEHLSKIATAFWRARVYVPIKPRCLLDSLAMTKLLAKRGTHARIVFGVTSDPFAAHAWVQVGDLVLTDTVGHATSHTPIRVV